MKKQVLFPFVMLVLAMLACNLPTVQPRNAPPAVTEEPLATPGVGFLPPLTGTEVPAEEPAMEAPADEPPAPTEVFTLKVKKSKGGTETDVKAGDVEVTLARWGKGLKTFPYDTLRTWALARGIGQLNVVWEVHNNGENFVVYLPSFVQPADVIALAQATDTVAALIYVGNASECMSFAPRADLTFKRGQLYDVPQSADAWTLPTELYCPAP